MLRKHLGSILLLLSFFFLSVLDVSAQISFTRHTIHSSLRGAYWVYAKDIDKDGDPDLVTAAFDGIDWWENNGSGNFSKHFIGSLQSAWGAHADDIDGDGDIDILGCSPGVDEVAWYKNKGGENFTKVLIDGTGLDPERVFTADLDDDGDIDILAPLWVDGALVWYENKGGNSFTKHTLDGGVSGAHSIYAADFNGDGKLDIVGAGSSRTRWYENTGNGNFTRHNLASNGAWSVFAADIDGDGDYDIVRTQRNNGDVDWFENNGSGSFSEHTIESGYGECWSAIAGDVDGDGDLDVVAAGFEADNIMVWFNSGNGNFGSGVVVDNVTRPRSVDISDIDGDGDGDIVAAIRDDRDLAWYEVQGTPGTPGTITVTYPNGGESFSAGQTVAVTWNSNGGFSNVKIELSTDNGSNWTTVKNSTSNDGQYNWTVSSTPSSLCLIRMSDAGDGSPSDISDAVFTIQGTSGGGNILTFNPTDDARVKASAPNSNYGDRSTLNIEDGAFLSYLKFNLSGISGSVGSAVLRLQVVNDSDDGGAIYLVSNDLEGSGSPWTENNLTYNNAPAINGTPLSSLSAVSLNEIVSFDVTSAVSGDGVVSFGIENSSTNKVQYSSKEGAFVPELLVDVGSGGPAQYTLTLTTQGQGTVSANPAGSIFDEGTDVDLTATPAAGWQFNGWSGDLSGSASPATVTMNEDKSVIATFIQQSGGGSSTMFNPVADARVKSSRPNNNYGDEDELRLRNGDPSYRTYLKFDVTGLSGPVQSALLRMYVTDDSNDGGTITKAENTYSGSGSFWSEQGITWNNQPDLIGAPLFSSGAVNLGQWVDFDVTQAVTGNGTVSFCLSNNSTNSVKYSAREGSQPPELFIQTGSGGGGPTQYTLSVSVQGSGTVDLNPTGGIYEEDTSVQLTAVPATGWEFEGWSGDLTGSATVETLTMDANKTVTATFSEITATQYTLTVATQGSGSVVLDPAGGIYDAGTSVELTATAAQGWQFSGWQDDLSGSGNPAQVSMDTNKSVTAVFTEIAVQQHTLTVTIQGSGTVDLNPPGGIYDEGSQVQLTANPASGWAFSAWTGDAGGAAGSITVTMDSDKSVTATFTEGSGGGGTFTFNPVEDARVKSSSPTRNYGSDDELRLRAGNPEYRSFLKFDVSGLSGSVSTATMRLYVTDGSVEGGEIYSVSNNYSGGGSWSEAGLTWSNAPDMGGAELSSVGTVSVGEWIEFDVTAAIGGDGAHSFGLLSNSSNSVLYSSKEGSNPPELIIETGSGGNLPPVANNDSKSTNKGLSVVIDVTGNDQDVDGTIDVTTVTVVEDVTHGTTAVNPFSGLVTYTPESGFTGTDIFKYRVDDDDGAVSNKAIVTISVTAGGGGTSALSFQPTDDGQVKLTEPGNNYGSKGSTKVEENKFNSYFKFDVSGITGNVQNATLRLYVSGASADGGSVYLVSNNFNGSSSPWNEGALAANNAPPITGSAVASVGSVALDAYVEVDVTNAVNGNGSLSFALHSNSSDQAKYHTKEGSNPPELIVEFSTTGASREEPLVLFEMGQLAEDNPAPSIPDEIRLGANYPNPFNAGTTIEYALPTDTHVELAIYNLLGQKIRELVNGSQAAGFKKVRWDGRNDFGVEIGSGIYFVRLAIGKLKLTRRIALQK